jgi:hypothetical protein
MAFYQCAKCINAEVDMSRDETYWKVACEYKHDIYVIYCEFFDDVETIDED